MDAVAGCYEYGNEPSDFTNDREFIEELRDCYLLNELFALCS
jgi:hypothetical protein